MSALSKEKMVEWQNLGLQVRAEISAGNPEHAQALLEKCWLLFPVPRSECSDSVSFVRGAIRAMAFSGRPALALRWISELKNVPVSDIDPGPDFLQGVTYYELGDMDQAFEYFKRTYTMSKGRSFLDEDPKYLGFYKMRIAKEKLQGMS